MQLSLFSFSSPSFFPKQSHPKHYICPCATYSLATFTWLTQSPLRSCGVASIITLKKEIKRKKNQGSTVHKQSKKGWHRHWKTYVQFLFLIFLRGRIRIHRGWVRVRIFRKNESEYALFKVGSEFALRSDQQAYKVGTKFFLWVGHGFAFYSSVGSS